MSIQSAVMRAADQVAGMLGLLDRPLDPDRLIARARRRTGLSDFGDIDFRDAMTRFLDSCSRESALTLFGRIATEWDVVRFLSNLLRMRAAEAADPLITSRPVERPIFITGLPRSGTTFLHRLMLIDPANRGPLVWETIFPFPEATGPDRRIATVNRQLRAFEKIAPEFAGLHPLEATSPQECSEITAHVFRSLRFDTNYLVPGYRAWLDADVELNRPAYRFHRRFLQHLAQPPADGRWVLKNPEHLFALPALRAVYPDARIIFVHRDPVKVLLSVAKLTEVLRRPFIRNIDPLQIGRDESARWVDGTRRMIEMGDDAGLPDPVCHVHHMDLITDPKATVEMVYRHFGMPVPDGVLPGIDRYIAERPRGGYGHAAYRFEDHGLNEAEERVKFRPYMIRFGITPESSGDSSRQRNVPPSSVTAG
ncbi:MAG: sulfotransferase [Acetobacteraceae bacterium]